MARSYEPGSYRDAIQKLGERQQKEMEQKRNSRPGPVKEGGISVAQRFKNWLMDDRLPEYMRQPGQDEYGRSKKAVAKAAAEEAKKNPPSQKSRSYSPNDIRMRKITPSKPPSQVTPRSVGVSVGEDATKSIRASASAPKPATPAKRSEVVMGTAPANKSERPDPVKKVPQATPTVSKPAAPRNYSTEAADKLKGLGLDEDNAVMKRLRERSAMSAKERDEAPKFESKYADKLNKALGFAKGGHVKANGIARKGKTRGRLI
jgi:hypothetical protein